MSMSMPMSMSLLNSQFNSMSIFVSLIIFNLQCLFQCQLSIQFKSMLIHFQLALGPTIMVMSIFQVNVNLPSICILLNQTSNLYLAICLVIGQVASSIQRTTCTCLYAYVSGQTTSSIQRTVCTLLMFCYRSNDKFDPKNSLHLPACCDGDQAANSIQRTACISLLSMSPGQTASSIQRTVCTCLSVCVFDQAAS
jgi:hypothetical protein